MKKVKLIFRFCVTILTLFSMLIPNSYSAADTDRALTSDICSTKTGNIFDSDESMELQHTLTNKSSEAVEAEIVYKLYNSDGNMIWEYSPDILYFDSNEKKTIYFTPDNADKFDIYCSETVLTEWYTEKTDNKRVYTLNESVSRVMAESNGNSVFGVCQQLSQGRGETSDIGASMKNAGLTILRDDVFWSLYDTAEKRERNLPVLKERISNLKENDIDFIALLWNNSEKKMSDGGNVPATESELDEWEEYCGTIAAELKEYTDYFEIWNEYNLELFNITNQPETVYVELLKRAYRAIKRENPNAVIIGATPSEVDFEFLREIFDNGALGFMDVLALHPYDWSGQFREKRYVENMKAVQTLMDRYGKRLPIWNTELGFSTCINDEKYGHTRTEQCAAIVRGWILNRAENLADKWIYYMYTDMDNEDDGESCFGLINGWSNKELTDYGAKESYLAVSAMNSLIGEYAPINSFADYASRSYAVNFYNSDLQKNILALESVDKPVKMTFYLGTKSVDILDMYGNKLKTLSSDNGIFTVDAGLEPIYVVGSFDKNITRFGFKEKVYSWNNNAESLNDIMTADFKADGGSWNVTGKTEPEFDKTENALLMCNDGTALSGEYEFFSCDTDTALNNGQIDLSFKFKTNGSRFAVMLDSGNGQDDSTVAMSIDPWGSWNDGVDGKTLSGKILYGGFPWSGTCLTESYELGQHTDDSFGEWITVKITAKPELKRFDLTLKNGETVIAEKKELEMAGSKIKKIVFAHFDEMEWNAKTYVKDIDIDYSSVLKAPDDDVNFYLWKDNAGGIDDVFCGGMLGGGGSWSEENENEAVYDANEKAILLTNGGSVKMPEYNYINYNFGSIIKSGRIDIGFKMKSNGSYFGVITDGGSKSNSTAVLCIDPWGTWNNGPENKKWTSKITAGGFPWNGTVLTESNEFGQLSDDGFGEWLTCEISVYPKEKYYNLTIKKSDGNLILKADNLKLNSSETEGIVFAHYDEMDWNSKTYIKDISIDYTAEKKVKIINILNDKGEMVKTVSKLNGTVKVNSQMNGVGYDYIIAAGSYDNDNKLLNVRFGKNRSEISDNMFCDEFDFEESRDAECVKFFVWKSNGELKPYDVPVIIQSEDK